MADDFSSEFIMIHKRKALPVSQPSHFLHVHPDSALHQTITPLLETFPPSWEERMQVLHSPGNV